jgi:serine protease Do
MARAPQELSAVIAISAKTGATRDIAESLAMHDPRGAIVVGVEENGPAAKAGLKSGDVISSAGGEPIKGASELTKKIHAIAPGSTELTVLRRGPASRLVLVQFSSANPR